MRFLVTGAQGCIGAWVVKQLLDQNLPVVTLDLGTNLERLELISGHGASGLLERVAGRIEDTELLAKLVKEREITHVIHLAAVLMPFCQTQPVAGGMINVIGTLNVFQAARDAGRAVRVVYASSSAVWGRRMRLARGRWARRIRSSRGRTMACSRWPTRGARGFSTRRAAFRRSGCGRGQCMAWGATGG
ncbi:MAG: GDP-mannose 4,6-dehydratase [Bryobacterales bacterium]|nr:GDP-mannose 4,6-dehydratase [Bryobacterales bacterium]